MPPNTRRPPPPSRFSLAKVCLEITDRIGRMPRGTHVGVARHLGVTSQTLSHRLTDPYRVPLSVEEIGAIADQLDAPIGWPFVPWDIAAARLGGPPR